VREREEERGGGERPKGREVEREREGDREGVSLRKREGERFLVMGTCPGLCRACTHTRTHSDRHLPWCTQSVGVALGQVCGLRLHIHTHARTHTNTLKSQRPGIYLCCIYVSMYLSLFYLCIYLYAISGLTFENVCRVRGDAPAA
jgi:hypothetical protein